VDKELEKIEDQIRKGLADSIRKSFAVSNFGDVMVVGGGISGVQASLDLATAGFKVYLVDKAPAIGGHMAQLDKTFPTNDCSI
jgi:heterodisulfide reductase subunit A